MNAEMKATWRKMVGTALFWVAFSALVYVSSSAGNDRDLAVAVIGFITFCFGLAIFADGMKRDVLNSLRREQKRPRQASQS
jgi:uncharacterized membrane protein